MKKYKWIFLGISLLSVALIGALLLLTIVFSSMLGIGVIHETEIKKEEVSNYENGVTCSGGTISKDKVVNIFEANAKGGALEGKGEYIIKSAKKHKVPPKIAIAIISMESGWGKGANATRQRNPYSIMGSGPLRVFPTIEDGIDAGLKNLYDLYISEGLTTPEKIGPKYAPVGASNDPTDLNSNWVPAVKKTVASLSSKDDKGMKCTSDGSDFNLKGSKFPKILKNTAYKFEPTYPWGQCTWYVHQRRKQIGKDVGLSMGNGGDWDDNARRQGFKVGNTPKEGSAASVSHGDFGSTSQYGHIMFVEKVNKDGSFVVSEANVKGLGVISFRKFTKAEGQRMAFIYDK